MNFKLSAMNCHYRFYEFEYFFATAKELGFKEVEIWTSPHHYFVDYNGYEDPDKLRTLADKYGVKIICLCPEQTNPKPNNMAAKDENQKVRVRKYFKNMIDIADTLKIKKVLVTSGWAFYNEVREDAWKRSVTMMRELCSYALSKNITLCIEALQPYESRLVTDTVTMKQYLDDVLAANLKVCIDMGAMAKAEETIDDYFKMFKEDVVHVHFVDGHPCGHLAWGDGTRNMKEDLQALENHDYQGYLSLENATDRYYENPKKADKQSKYLFDSIVKGGKV
ncbi:MAG: sugar phosphate isomerase/epimerase family protein [Erysipelotrichaceae bacterium]